MTETVKLGVPVVVTIDRHNPPPQWWGNATSGRDIERLGPLEREVRVIQKNNVVKVIFPTLGHYTMFVLKWS